MARVHGIPSFSTLLAALIAMVGFGPELAFPQRPASAQAKPSATLPTITQRAESAWKDHQYEKAVQAYRQSVDIRPTWSEGWQRLGECFYRLDRYAESRDASRQATILTPENAPSWAYLGLSEYEL